MNRTNTIYAVKVIVNSDYKTSSKYCTLEYQVTRNLKMIEEMI